MSTAAATYPRTVWPVPATADYREAWATVNRHGTVVYYETEELAMWSD